MQNSIVSFSAVFLYIVSGSLLGLQLFGKNKSYPPLFMNKYTPISLGLVAVLLHAFTLYQLLFTPLGLNIGFFNAISLISWLMALTLLTASITNPVENLGTFLLPVAALFIVLELAFPVEHTVVIAQAIELKLHIVISFMAYSLLTIAAVHALVLATQDRHLRNKRPGGFIRALPPLQTMETLLFQMITVGFILHSLSLVTGFVYLEDMFSQHIAHKTVLSIAAWFVFAILLWGRWRFGWRGATAIRWTISGFITLILAYIGSKYVLEIILGR